MDDIVFCFGHAAIVIFTTCSVIFFWVFVFRFFVWVLQSFCVLSSSLEIDEDSRDDKIPTRPKTTTPPDSIGGNDVETHRSHPIDTWISPQKMSLEKCKRRMSASGKTELFEEDDIRNQQLILNEEIDLSASLSLSSYKSNIEVSQTSIFLKLFYF